MASDLVRWAKSPRNRDAVKAVGVLAAATVAVTGVWYFTNKDEIQKAGGLFAALFKGLPTDPTGKRGAPNGKPDVPKGSVVCPKDIGKLPANISTLKRGDFVIIELASKDKKSIEPTWARVRSLSPTKDRIYVEIAGEFTEQGIKPIKTKKHGFYLGEKLILDKECVFDVLHVSSKLTGQILCGPNLGVVDYGPVDTKRVSTQNIVRIVVGSPEAQGSAWHEALWVHVTSISPTSQIIHGIVAENPKLTAQHGLSKYSRVEFGRDCVVDVSNPYLLGDS